MTHFLLLFAVGCAFDESIPEIDIAGTIRVPRAAATRTVMAEDGSTSEVTDERFIGPVYLGAWSSIENDVLDYPHPEMGPVLSTDQRGDTYPYGGTTVGRFSFACFESVACKVVTGRFPDFNSILDYFHDYIGDPVTDPYTREVTSTDYYEQYCYDYFHVTTLQELTFLAVDEDGNPSLDFAEDENGDFVATFKMYHTAYTPGMQVWGWMDRLDEDYDFFTTCDENRTGPNSSEYNLDFYAGGAFPDILVRPWTYIQTGDWIVQTPFTMDTPDASPELVVDFNYE